MAHLQHDLIGLSEHTFQRTRARLEGLTDEELAWEPAPWCWSVRRVGDGYRLDGSAFPPEVPVFTTIAWRLDHLVGCYGASRNAEWLGQPALGPLPPTTISAASEIDRLDEGYRRWRSVVEGADEASLATKLGPIGGQYAEATRAAFLLHQLDEVIHHGAEIGAVRDLYRSQSLTPPALDTVAGAAANGRWDIVVRLAEGGAEVNGGRVSALHLAVAAAAPEVVRILLARGADREAHDAQYDMTPLGWAEFFENDELIALLR